MSKYQNSKIKVCYNDIQGMKIPHRYVSPITISRGKREPKNININKSSTIEI
jgi:hypothetical protein